MQTLHYLDLANRISADYGYDINDVLDDLFAVILRLKLDPKELDVEKVDQIRLQVIARAETVDQVLRFEAPE